jgi:DNA-binding SARP family transcriptional activator
MKVSEEKPLSIRVLGLPEVSFEGRRLRFGRKKVLALLCYLATEGRKRSRRELAELFWPNSDERRARKDLRSALTGSGRCWAKTAPVTVRAAKGYACSPSMVTSLG